MAQNDLPLPVGKKLTSSQKKFLEKRIASSHDIGLLDKVAMDFVDDDEGYWTGEIIVSVRPFIVDFGMDFGGAA